MYKQEKVNKAIQKQLALIILKEFDFSEIVTVTRVECAPNMFSAKVYVSVIPKEKKLEVIKRLANNIQSIQKHLNKTLKIRPVPRIEFVKEEKTEKAARIEKILRDIEKKEKKC